MAEEHSETRSDENVPLEEQLENLLGELKDAEALCEEKQSEIASTQTQIDSLKKLLADWDKIQEAYNNEHGALKDDDRFCRDYLKNETACLEQILENELEQIAEAIATCKAAAKAAQDDVTAAESKLKVLIQTRLDAEKDRKKFRSRLDQLTDIVAKIKARFSQLQVIKSAVKTAHDAGDYAVAYWLLVLKGEFEEILNGDPKLISPGQLPKQLQTAWEAFTNADKAYADADWSVKKHEEKLEDLRKTRDEKLDALEADIRNKLKAIQPSQSQAA